MSSLTPEQLSNLLDNYFDRIINKTDPDTIVGVNITTTVTHSDGSITEFVDIHTPTEESSSVNKKPAPLRAAYNPQAPIEILEKLKTIGHSDYRSNCFPDDK